MAINNFKRELIESNQFEDNKYLDLYCDLIKSNKKREKEIYKTQKHHIIPRCYFKYNNLEIDDSQENLVNLLYKDHILAHYYLCLCCIDSILSYKLFAGLTYIIKSKRLNPTTLESLKELDLDNYQLLYQEYIRNISLDKERCLKISSKLTGGKRTPEQALHISLSRLGTPIHNSDSKQKISKNMKGKNKSPKSDYLKSQVSKANLGNNYRKGKHLSVESKQAIRLSHLGKGNIPIICIETQVNYSSIKEASEILNINSDSISKACRGIDQIKAGGYHWAYAEDTLRQESLKEFIGKPPTKKRDNSSRIKISNSNKQAFAKSPKDNSFLKKPILCIETNQVFQSLTETKKWIGKGDIGSYMMGRQSYAGTLEDGTKLHWRYIDE